MSKGDDMSIGNFPVPQPSTTTLEGGTPDPATRTTVEPDGRKVTTDTRSTSEPHRLEHDRMEPIGSGNDVTLSATLACSDVTGEPCDYIARPDDSASWAPRGQVQEQLLTQITTHIGKIHPEKVLSQEDIEELRESLVG